MEPFSVKVYLFLLIFVIELSACSSAPAPKGDLVSDQERFAFVHPLSPNTEQSLRDYLAHQKLNNGLEYGSFVRNFHLKGESSQSIREKLSHALCRLKEDVIREPKENTPILDKMGNTAPIWIWLCADGGIIRIKPKGDPTSKFRPEPHGSKALRYPPTGMFHGFSDETLKIDEAGNPLPKWPADLQSKDPKVINDWANAVHTDLENH